MKSPEADGMPEPTGESSSDGFVARIRTRVAQERPLPSASASTNRSKALAKRCDACLDENGKDVVKLPCSHQMCKECILQLFTHASQDVSLLPVRCCRQEVSILSVASLLPQHLRKSLQDKMEELQAKDKMYCPMPKCSAFINLDKASGLSSHLCCPGCGVSLCTRCRRKWHPGKGCRKHTKASHSDIQVSMQMMRVAKAQGWRQCPGCKTIVELKAGCNHVTCSCHCQFCYKCGSVWKTCQCAIFDADSTMPDLESDYHTALREQENEFYVGGRSDIRYDGDESEHDVGETRSGGCRVHRFQKHNVQFDLLAGKWKDCSSCRHFLRNVSFSCQKCDFEVCQACYYAKF